MIFNSPVFLIRRSDAGIVKTYLGLYSYCMTRRDTERPDDRARAPNAPSRRPSAGSRAEAARRLQLRDDPGRVLAD